MIHLDTFTYDSVVQGTWTQAGAAYLDVMYAVNTTGDSQDGDGIQWKTYMPAGTYTCKVMASTWTNQGIAKVKIDGVEVMSIDKYEAQPGTVDKIWTETDISVASSGVKTIQWICDGKNANSTAYRIHLQMIVFYRTA